MITDRIFFIIARFENLWFIVVVLAQKYKKIFYLYQTSHKKHCSVSLNVYNLWVSSFIGASQLLFIGQPYKTAAKPTSPQVGVRNCRL